MRKINLYDTSNGELVREISVEWQTGVDMEAFAKNAEKHYSDFYGKPLFAEIE